MLSPRNKIIILIAGSVILFILLIGAIFGWFRKSAPVPGTGESAVKPDLSFLQEQPTVQGQVFDASNPQALTDYDPQTGVPVDAISTAERAARNLAILFAERFGTYSSDAGSAYVDDLQGLMTVTMQAWTRQYLKTQPRRTGYFAITSEVASLETKLFSPEKKEAKFALVVNRSETGAENSGKYQQKADIELTQAASGEWKVNSLYWGERL